MKTSLPLALFMILGCSEHVALFDAGGDQPDGTINRDASAPDAPAEDVGFRDAVAADTGADDSGPSDGAEDASEGEDATPVDAMDAGGIDAAISDSGPSICGNGTVEPGETCDPPFLCPASCNDGSACTIDSEKGDPSTCDIICTSTPITLCIGGDGCCPGGCINANDSDCAAPSGWTYPPGLQANAPGSPAPRYGHGAAWIGNRMILWGGTDDFGSQFFGAVYDRASDTWVTAQYPNLASGTGGPGSRIRPIAAWTGSRLLLFGGGGSNVGGVYDPATDTWESAMYPNFASGNNAPTPSSPVGAWDALNSRLIVFGPTASGVAGGYYTPSTDTWTRPPNLNGGTAPIVYPLLSGVYADSQLIVWGGAIDFFNQNDRGEVYDPGTDTWVTASFPSLANATNAALRRHSHTAVWTGDRMLVWGGQLFAGGTAWLSNGSAYDLAQDSWSPPPGLNQNSPNARTSHSAVWTGSEMIVWGGAGPPPVQPVWGNGAIYRP